MTAELNGQCGVYLKTIRPGGAADTDGQLRVGDRLLQVSDVCYSMCGVI